MNKFDRLYEFFKQSIKVHTNYSKNKEKKFYFVSYGCKETYIHLLTLKYQRLTFFKYEASHSSCKLLPRHRQYLIKIENTD